MILLPALLAGLLVTATHVPLGVQVLARGIVFIDLAIAQIAGLGVICADWLGFEPNGWAVQVSAPERRGAAFWWCRLRPNRSEWRHSIGSASGAE